MSPSLLPGRSKPTRLTPPTPNVVSSEPSAFRRMTAMSVEACTLTFAVPDTSSLPSGSTRTSWKISSVV